MVSQQIRVAVLFERFGPYHHARLNAAGKLMQVFGLEACRMDDTYGWEKVEGAASFTRLTLTDRDVQSPAWKRELRQRMWKALDEMKPQAVAVPGWSSAEALGALSWCLQTHTPAIMMSDSTVWDARRVFWKERIKARFVGICTVGLVAGTPHKDYLLKLGMPAERVFLGYDAVDNGYFAEKAEMLKTESRNRESEVKGHPPAHSYGATGKAEVAGQESEVRSPMSEVRARYGVPEHYFLASARFVEKKNLPRLLEAFARYRELAVATDNRTTRPQDNATAGGQRSEVSGPVVGSPVVPWSLVLLGDGPLKAELCRLISDLGLQQWVLLPGFKQYDELPTYYGLASAFVHASTTEQWGLVVNEAMASGLPVLVSNRCGCVMDLVQEGVNGFTFDPCNVEQLAQLMFQISAFQPVRLSTFGNASREIISHWGPERFGEGLQQAVACALRVPPPKTSLVDRLLLRALLMR